MIIKATFTGTNSLGYKNGKEYVLKVRDVTSIVICRINNTGECQYESLSAFLINWNNIEVLS